MEKKTMENKKFNGNFNILDTIDISNIKKILLNNINKFCEANNIENNIQDIKRVNTNNSPHTHVKHLTFFFDSKEFNRTIIKPYNQDILPLLLNDLNNITNIVHKYYNNNNLIIGRCLATNLKSNSIISKHRDGGNIVLLNGHRLHIPIITNKLVSFSVGNETKILQEGTIYEINNLRQHSVENNSNEDRLHLIIDYIEPDILNNTSKLRT